MSDAPWPQGLYCWVMPGHAFSRWHAFTHGHGIRMAWNAVDDRGAGPWEQTWEAGPARKAGVWGPGSRQHGGAGCQVCWGETVTGLGWPSDPPGSSFLRVLDAPLRLQPGCFFMSLLPGSRLDFVLLSRSTAPCFPSSFISAAC